MDHWLIFALGAFMGAVMMLLVLGCCIIAREADDKTAAAGRQMSGKGAQD